jgi:hypothetical protein
VERSGENGAVHPTLTYYITKMLGKKEESTSTSRHNTTQHNTTQLSLFSPFSFASRSSSRFSPSALSIVLLLLPPDREQEEGLQVGLEGN